MYNYLILIISQYHRKFKSPGSFYLAPYPPQPPAGERISGSISASRSIVYPEHRAALYRPVGNDLIYADDRITDAIGRDVRLLGHS